MLNSVVRSGVGASVVIRLFFFTRVSTALQICSAEGSREMAIFNSNTTMWLGTSRRKHVVRVLLKLWCALILLRLPQVPSYQELAKKKDCQTSWLS